MRRSLARLSALLGVLGVAVAGLALGAGTAAAFPVTVSLVPSAGSIATGGGSISVDPAVTPPTISISLAGAHPSTTFLVSACSLSFGCVNNGAADEFTTDITGAFNGALVTPAPVTFDYVSVVDVANPADAYQASVSGLGLSPSCTLNPFFVFLNNCISSVTLPPGLSVAPNGTVLAPPGTQVIVNAPVLAPVGSNEIMTSVCPTGFVGWVTTFVGGTYQTVYCTGL
ncbi:MAG TPA: hypothetical protein VFA70_14055 [Dehalococcoidia bacterium]|jgi:hypothetical protein|nr:hypothetical protein [Dehalococcoidia bacterium]